MKIKLDDLKGDQIITLLDEHLNDLACTSPPESMHALDLVQLRDPSILFWSAWDGDDLMGCGALKKLDKYHGEIKSMRTVPEHLRKGVAQAMLEHIISAAKQLNFRQLSLETGSQDVFKPARKLYEKFEFEYCQPFADYGEDPNSVFMRKLLN